MLAAAVRAAGGLPVRAPVVPDRPGALLRAVGPHLAEVDLVVTSAGVSEGVHDVVKADLSTVGVTFSRVRMQPGRPQGAGWLDGVPVLTLPGNPASAYVSFHVFVRPVLRRMLGHPAGPVPTLAAALTEPVRSPAGRRRHLRARRSTAPDGTPRVTPSGGPGSHLLGGLGVADCLLVLAEDVTDLPAGAAVTIIPTEGALP
jgi:molybdopterin molybdotransferase